ncbi:MAG: Hsp20/alpha crystallin family protein [Gammaproteobacteria bacterium]|nr:Hsp20/alpha crystallin family protein [Gammaproteobacteria bacterium]MCP5425851.1 Hsp20/alpha crystallin family protein [Gammaproteobacteria bacterium]MCP5458548.1 Hsp20/alpha crystallin family protein [Gammaproteobacteria bacterium]
MAVIRYEPLNLLNQLQREVNRLFDTSRLGDEGSALTSDWAPAVDIKDENDRFVIHADVPGVDGKDIEITMEKGVLTLKGQRVSENKEENEKYKRIERVRGTFLRRFSLPDSVDADQISAKTKDGVLEVIVPKGKAAQPHRIQVESN